MCLWAHLLTISSSHTADDLGATSTLNKITWMWVYYKIQNPFLNVGANDDEMILSESVYIGRFLAWKFKRILKNWF